MKFNYDEQAFLITRMDGVIDDEAIKGDFICITNIDVKEILDWLDKHKWTSTIYHKEREFKGTTQYPEVFIFENRKVLDKFAEALKICGDCLEEDFISQDIKYMFSSSMDTIRIIKSYNLENKTENIKEMCEFIDIKSFEDKKEEDILFDRLFIRIDHIDYKYREIFYYL